MPKDIYEFINAAKIQLPEAFASRDSYPWPDLMNSVPVSLSTSYPLHKELPTTLVRPDYVPPPPDFPLPKSLGEEFAKPVDMDELNEAIGENGTEALAVYISFHNPLPDKSWGVFLFGEPIWRLREDIRQQFLGGASDAHTINIADWLAVDLVKYHEYYHFRADLYALHQELILRKPLYLPYSNDVYPLAWCTSDCYEESLANLSLCDHARNTARNNLHRLIITRRNWYQYAIVFCDKQPPGYRDYRRPQELLRQGLGGQINFGQSQMLLVPQSEWVGLHPSNIRRDCPVYLIQRTPSSRSGPWITIKCAGDQWRFHLFDQDPFPSIPHGHNLATGEKLNPYTGERFSPHGRDLTGKVPARHLRRVQVDIARKWPHIVFN